MYNELAVVGLYPNIPHGEGLASLRRFLETRDNKQISSDTLTELAELVLMKKNLMKRLSNRNVELQ